MQFSKSFLLAILASAAANAYLQPRYAAYSDDDLLDLDTRSLGDEEYFDLYARDESEIYDALIARHLESLDRLLEKRTRHSTRPDTPAGNKKDWNKAKADKKAGIDTPQHRERQGATTIEHPQPRRPAKEADTDSDRLDYMVQSLERKGRAPTPYPQKQSMGGRRS